MLLLVVYRQCEAVCGLVLLALLAEERATSLQDFGWVEVRVEFGMAAGAMSQAGCSITLSTISKSGYAL